MDTLYAVVHRTAGPLATFPTVIEAAQEMVRVLIDEPEWVNDLSLERFEVVVEDEG